MRSISRLMLVTGFMALATLGTAQEPAKKPQEPGRPGARPEARPGAQRPGGDRPGARPEGGRPGAGAFGARGGMMAPGQILPPFLAERLKLTEDQKKALEKLQKETDEKLNALLTDEQRDTLKQMKERGPGGDRGRPGVEGGRPGAPRPGGAGRPGARPPVGK